MQVMMMMILTVMIRVTIIMNSSSYREEPVAVILNILIRQRRNAKKYRFLYLYVCGSRGAGRGGWSMVIKEYFIFTHVIVIITSGQYEDHSLRWHGWNHLSK